MQAPAAKAAGVKPQDAAPAGMSSDEDEKDEHLGIASGVQDPLGQAIVHLSSIVQEMRAEKKQRKDKGLEAILDRAESGSARDTTGSSRSKASALRSLQKLLVTDPKLIYQALEKNLQGDWETGGSNLPGAQITRISARGWLEHRSRISSYPGTIRPAWLCAGIWDALMQGCHEEARARAALATACFDQRSRCMAFSKRADSGTTSSVCQLQQPHCTGSMGGAAHSSHRRQVVRAVHGKTQRACGVPGEERKTRCSGEDKERGPTAKGRRQAERKRERWKEGEGLGGCGSGSASMKRGVPD